MSEYFSGHAPLTLLPQQSAADGAGRARQMATEMLLGWSKSGADKGGAELLQLPSADFWREELPQVRGARYLSFDLAGATFGVPLAHVREVDALPRVAPVPNLPAWVVGAANMRGEIISVVDLVAFLGLGSTGMPRSARLLACRAGGMDAGLLVERVRDVRELPDAAIRPPAGSLPGRAGRFLAGVHAGDRRLTLILDVARLFQSPEFRRFE